MLPVPVEGVVEMIRHSGMGRFRRGAVSRSVGQGGRAGVAGLGLWPGMCARQIDVGALWVGRTLLVTGLDCSVSAHGFPKMLCDIMFRHIAV